MAYTFVNFLLRRTVRFPLSSAIFVQRIPSLCFYSTAYYSTSSHLIHNFLTQRVTIMKPAAFLFLRFSSSKVEADENLENVLQSEIECANETEEHGREIGEPEDFPFEIIDNSGDQTVILKREFFGENIQATVYVNFDGEDMKNVSEDDSEVDDQECSIASNISLLVTIDKGEASVLEIGCNISSDLVIESMILKSTHGSDDHGAYQGPEFSDLDESLQKTFYKFLKVRGFDSSLRDFLLEYMMSKDEREYRTWLKNVKDFIRN